MTTLLFLGTEADAPYLHRLKSIVGTASVFISLTPITTWYEAKSVAQKRNCTGIFSTSLPLLRRLSGEDSVSLDSYAGSFFLRDSIEVVFVSPLEQLVTVPYGAFLASRYISKLHSPSKWISWPEFSWSLGSPQNISEIHSKFNSAYAIAIDIETTKTNLAITSISFTGVFLTPESAPTFQTVVLEMDSMWAYTWAKIFCTLPSPKIFQNGKYDNSYLLRYGIPVTNWLFDTANAFHSWYAELPKDLGFLQAFFHREGRYWKAMAHGDAMQRLEYNGRDTYATAIAFLGWLLEAPSWAKTNYLQEFPLNFPCLLAEMTGIKRDMEELKLAEKEAASAISSLSSSLDVMLGVQNFNTNSPKQMKDLLKILGCGDLPSADETNLKKAAFRHPLNTRILEQVIAIRKQRKLLSTYLLEGKEHNGRILYSLNPHGTDTGRLASKEHHFWCGLQIQNIPRGISVKRTLVADDGFRIAECDLEQAESRDTAHIAGDESLIAAVSGDRDFHSVNASAFFGVPYSSIYCDETKKTLNTELRNLAKRVNHGANYNMGPDMLVETMGLKNIYRAAQLLGLPRFWLPRQIAEFLLACFHKTYLALRKTYYTGVISEIKTTKMLRSKAIHSSPFHVAGWTRYCFSDPEKSKTALNAYVAHAPQSLNAITLNKAFLSVFYRVALPNPTTFRLLAQIHDSILFLYKVGHEYHCQQVKEAMEIPIKITGYDGNTRIFTVPAAIKANDAKRWSETE